jgi:hypothetical protein
LYITRLEKLTPRTSDLGLGWFCFRVVSATASQRAEAFLRTLTGSSIYSDEKFSSPFNADNTLAVVVLPSDPTEMSFSGQEGTETVTLRASGVPNVGYLFQTSPDLVTWTSTAINASAAGDLEMTVPIDQGEDGKFYRFAYGVNLD